MLRNFVVRNSYMAIFLADSSPTIRNVTVCDNEFGVAAFVGAQPDISDSIFWNNAEDDLLFCQARYSCIEDGDEGLGNICEDPLFAGPDNDDYHLKSEAGRWCPLTNIGPSLTGYWVFDDVTSRCIDAGNPGASLVDEPLAIPLDPNNIRGCNLRIDMGAYGETAQAGIAPHDWQLLADLTNDGIVDFSDFAYQASQWLSYKFDQPPDMNYDGTIDVADFGSLAEDWLKMASWCNQ